MSSCITKEQFLEFIRTKRDKGERLSKPTQHYLNYFDKYQSTSQKGNWNWMAFTPLWWLYRRMYANLFLLIGTATPFDLIVTAISQNLPYSMAVELFLSLAFLALVSRYADYFYLKHAEKKISKGVLTSGTNFIPVAVLGSIYAILHIWIIWRLI